MRPVPRENQVMKDNQQFRWRLLLLAATIAILALSSQSLLQAIVSAIEIVDCPSTIAILALSSLLIHADSGTCGGVSINLPFTDVQASNVFFCSIAEAYFTGLTNGTSPTTYNPSDPVSREQMAAFITRTQDSALKRGSKRAALQHWWTPGAAGVLRSTSITNPAAITSDGEDVWVISNGNTVKRVHASDGRVLQTWTSANGASSLVAASGRIFISVFTGTSTPGKIYVINPDAAPGAVSVFENDIGVFPRHIAYDGLNLWTANTDDISSGSISRDVARENSDVVLED